MADAAMNWPQAFAIVGTMFGFAAMLWVALREP